MGVLYSHQHLDAPDDDDEVLEIRPAAEPPAAIPPGPAPPATARDKAATAALGPMDTPRLLARQAHRELGPLTDEMVAGLRGGLARAGSLTEYANWLANLSALPIDATPLADTLGQALVAGALAGRYDVQEKSGMQPNEAVATASLGAESDYLRRYAALAVDSADSAHLPFQDQIAFFRDKLSLDTTAWTDIWQEQHDVAFVVAGAARDDVLGDLRTAVDSAIAEGTTLETFRGRFDEIVEQYGWSYKGGRDWRTRVIYDTNIRTSYAAGRWSQMQDIKDRRPWWRYRHSGIAENPRDEHVAWDGLVLSADDPWWQTHYPPNGWGCGCLIETLSDSDLHRLGKDGPDTAPALDQRTETVGTTGPNPRTVQVPAGIDPGFGYAPGRQAHLGAAVREQLRKNLPRPPALAAASAAQTLGNPRALQALAADWRQFHRQSRPGAHADHAEAFQVGVVSGPVQDALRKLERSVVLDSALITTTRGEVKHFGRDKKQERGQALDDADMDRLPEILAAYEAVLWDTVDERLVYVASAVADSRKAKVAIAVNYSAKIKLGGDERKRVTSNSIRTTGYVDATDLKGGRYVPLDGKIE